MAGKYQSDYLLPVHFAEAKMALWVPWAIYELNKGIAALAAAIPQLTSEQQLEVDAHGDDYDDDDD